MKLYEIFSAPVASNKNFKNWFRNSKVVDKSNAPLVVYHGTNAHAYVDGEIESFYTSGERGAAFFTSNHNLAREYGEKVYGVFLRIENPLVVYGNGKYWESLGADQKISGNITDALRKHHQKSADDLSELFSDTDLFPEGGGAAKSKIPDHETSLDKFNLGLIGGDHLNSTDDIVKRARRFGYDGVIFHDVKDSPTTDNIYRHQNSDVYAVFSANQVKSAENRGSFSSNDSNIRA
jgi:hypothetical protein